LRRRHTPAWSAVTNLHRAATERYEEETCRVIIESADLVVKNFGLAVAGLDALGTIPDARLDATFRDLVPSLQKAIEAFSAEQAYEQPHLLVPLEGLLRRMAPVMAELVSRGGVAGEW
jgi:hypothetical protein